MIHMLSGESQSLLHVKESEEFLLGIKESQWISGIFWNSLEKRAMSRKEKGSSHCLGRVFRWKYFLQPIMESASHFSCHQFDSSFAYKASGISKTNLNLLL